jgi:hypothetical protein
MKHLITLFLMLTLFPLQAQKLERSLLWKISGKGLEKPSYLFGTIHASCDATLDKNILEALNQTAQLYLEIDMDDPGMQSELMQYVMMKDGKKMSQMANESDAALLDAFLTKQTGYSLEMLNTIKPFFVSAMLIPKLLDCDMQSLEGELMKISKEQKEEIYGLETIKDQMDVFDVIPYQEQMDELLKSAKNNLVDDKKEFQELLEIYNTKDVTALLEVSEKSKNTMVTKFENELLINRNKNWIPKMEKTIHEKPTFFGVGAAHLGGENGVIVLLRKQGYTVKAVL